MLISSLKSIPTKRESRNGSHETGVTKRESRNRSHETGVSPSHRGGTKGGAEHKPQENKNEKPKNHQQPIPLQPRATKIRQCQQKKDDQIRSLYVEIHSEKPLNARLPI